MESTKVSCNLGINITPKNKEYCNISMCNKGKICFKLRFWTRQVQSTGCRRQTEEYPFWKIFWISKLKGGLFFYLFSRPSPRPCISFQLWWKCGRKHFSRWGSQGRKIPDCRDKKAQCLHRISPMAGAHKAWWCYAGNVDKAEAHRPFSWRAVRRQAQQREQASSAILVDLILQGNSFSYQDLGNCHNWAGKDGSSEGEILFGTRSLFYCIIHLLSTYVNSRSKAQLARAEGAIARWSLSIGRRILWAHLRQPRQWLLQGSPQGDTLCLT